MGLWFRRFEEGVWQISHPHGYRRRHDGAFRVHHGVKKRLQVGLRVTPNMDDLVPGRRVVLARIHYPKKFANLYVSENVAFRNSQKQVLANSKQFFHAAGNLEISTRLSKSYPESF